MADDWNVLRFSKHRLFQMDPKGDEVKGIKPFEHPLKAFKEGSRIGVQKAVLDEYGRPIDKNVDGLIRIKTSREDEGFSETGFHHLKFSRNKLRVMDENGITRKIIRLHDGTQIFLKGNEEGEGERVDVKTPKKEEEERKPQYSWMGKYINGNFPIPVPEIYKSPFASSDLIGFILSEDRYQTGKGMYLDNAKVTKDDHGRFYWGSLVKDTLIRVNLEENINQIEKVTAGVKFNELEQFETTTQFIAPSTYKYVSNENSNYYIQWDYVNYILSFPDLTLPALSKVIFFTWEGSILDVAVPTLSGPRIYKFPEDSDKPEPVYMYNILYLPVTYC